MGEPRLLTTTGAEAYGFPLLIKHLFSTLPQHRAQEIVSGDLRLTYADFEERVRRLASALQHHGVEAGDTVAVMDWDSHRYLECFFAIPMMGALIQTVNIRLSPQQIAFTLNATRPALIILHEDFAALYEEVLPMLVEPPRLIRFAGDDESNGYEELLASSGPEFEFPDFDENAIATTFHTTGTTGNPKQVFFSHRQLVLHTLGIGTALAIQPDGEGLRPSDVYMPITPMFHVHAWGMPFLATMLGLKQVYPGRYDPKKLIELKLREKVTFSHCVPTIVRMLLDAAREMGTRLSPWTMIIGGSALPPALAEEAADAGITAVAGYGMSETGPIVTLSRSTPAGELALRCRGGFPIPLVYLRVDSAAGNELLLRSPWLTQGYATQEASDVLWSGGWLHTGDVAAIDADGAVRISDRLKDVIKSGGEWISSLELEAMLMERPDVAQVAVVGVPDDKWGERPVAFVVPPAGAKAPSPDALRDHLAAYAASGRISHYAIPDRFEFIAALPRTSVGKIDKKALKQQAALIN